MQLFPRRINSSIPHEVDSPRNNSGLRLLIVGEFLLLIGYVALFLLLQSPSLWVKSNLVADRWPGFYNPLNTFVMTLLGRMNGSGDFGLLNSRFYHLLLILLFAVYLFVVFRAFRSDVFSGKSGKAPLRIILVITAAILVVLLFAPGAFTGDLFSYIWYGRVFALHGGNPFIDVPSAYAAQDAAGWLRYLDWPDLPSAYGPVWTIIAGNLYMFSRMIDDHIVTHLLSHKLLASVLHLVNIWLLWHVAREVISRYWPAKGRARERVHTEGGTQLPALRVRSSWRRGAQVGITLTYAWNPLLLVEFGVSGHNDGLAMPETLLAAIWLHLAGRWRWAVMVLALGSLAKLTEGLTFIGPYLAFLFWETRKTSSNGTMQLLMRMLSRLGQALGIVAATWVLVWLPFWRGPGTLKIYTENPTRSITYIL